MRKLAIITGLGLAAAAVAGFAAAAYVDTGSAVVIAVVVALGAVVIGLIEWTHGGHHDLPLTTTAVEHVRDQDTRRALDELRAARSGSGHVAVNHALRSV